MRFSSNKFFFEVKNTITKIENTASSFANSMAKKRNVLDYFRFNEREFWVLWPETSSWGEKRGARQRPIVCHHHHHRLMLPSLSIFSPAFRLRVFYFYSRPIRFLSKARGNSNRDTPLDNIYSVAALCLVWGPRRERTFAPSPPPASPLSFSTPPRDEAYLKKGGEIFFLGDSPYHIATRFLCHCDQV